MGVGKTGVYMLFLENYMPIKEKSCEHVMETEMDIYNFINVIETTINKYKYNFNIYIVVEEFINYAHKQEISKWKVNKVSELIGMLKNLAYKNNLLIITQQASLVKGIMSDSVLVKRKMIYKGKDNRYYTTKENIKVTKHQRDALRHTLVFYMRLRNDRFKEELKVIASQKDKY